MSGDRLLGELRAVLGPEPSDEALRSVLRAAKDDLSAAANLYFDRLAAAAAQLASARSVRRRRWQPLAARAGRGAQLASSASTARNRLAAPARFALRLCLFAGARCFTLRGRGYHP